MSNTKHTPGPWIVRHQYNVFAGKRSIAGCGGYTSNDPNEDTHEANMANACLIAAAPDLLAVAESNLKIIQGVYDTPIETGLLGILDYGILEQAIAETTAAIAAAKTS